VVRTGQDRRINAHDPIALPEIAGLVELLIDICQQLVGEELDGKFGEHVNWAVALHVGTELAGLLVDDERLKFWLPW
jgi:hypothetical protein